MIHGVQKIELTYRSVQEALQDYLLKHSLASVVLEVSAWKAEQNYSPNSQTVLVEFIQKEST